MAGMRMPWVIVGVLVGAAFIRTWPGQNEIGLFAEIAFWCGGGALAGFLIETWMKRRPD